MERKMPHDQSGHDIVVRQWNEDDFAKGQRAWTELLSHSDANPLFMSWEWHFNWWNLYSDNLCKLNILCAYIDNQLVGIAPFYIEHDTYLKGIVPVKRMQFIGKRFGGSAGVRTEYLGIIVSKRNEKAVVDTLIDSICQQKNWNELSFSECNAQNSSYRILVNSLKRHGLYSRSEAEGASYLVDSTTSFEKYLESLGKNTRLKLYNRRKLLEKLGDVELVLLSEGNSDFFVKALNAHLSARWNRVILTKRNWDFICSLCNSSGGNITYADSSMLCLNEEPISVMLNIRVERVVYSILLGYKQGFDKKFSLGLMHCGYLFESCFNDSGTQFVDMLEGNGKNNNYKARIAETTVHIKSIRCFRSLALKSMFRFYDRFLRKA